MKIMITAATLTILPQLVAATGMYQCETVAQNDWMTKTELTDKLETDGWSVRFMKPDGGCWEVYGTMPDGKRVEGYFHPATGETLLISQRGTVLFRADD